MKPVLQTAVTSEYQDFENQYYNPEMESGFIFKEHLPGVRHGAKYLPVFMFIVIL